MTNQNKKNQIFWLRHRAEDLERNLANAQKQIEKIPELNQEIEYLKSQFVDGDIAGNKCRIRNLETQLETSQNQNAENEVLLREKDNTIAEYLCRVENLETQLQTSQDKNTEYKVLLKQKDEKIDEYLKEINKMNRALASDQKLSKIFSVLIYGITIWILNSQ